jgi:thioredoxin
MDPIQHLTEDTFDDAITEASIVMIDFWASWCWPCRAMATQFERAAEHRPEYRFAKVNVDAEPALASRCGIASIPTIVVLRDGEPVGAQTGVIAAEQLAGALDPIAATPKKVAA